MESIGDLTSCFLANYWNRVATAMALYQLRPVTTSTCLSGNENAISSVSKDKQPGLFLIADILKSDVNRRQSGYGESPAIDGSEDNSKRKTGNRKRNSLNDVVRPWERLRKTSASPSGAGQKSSSFPSGAVQRSSSSQSGDAQRSSSSQSGAVQNSSFPSDVVQKSSRFETTLDDVRLEKVRCTNASLPDTDVEDCEASANSVTAHRLPSAIPLTVARNKITSVSPLSALYEMTKNNFDCSSACRDSSAECSAEGGIDFILQQCFERENHVGIRHGYNNGYNHTTAIRGAKPLPNKSPRSETTMTSSPSPPEVNGGADKKRRKSRTAFTGHQLRELERRFTRQKYLLPIDRDSTARELGLTNAQVITWFQNRRAKLKRDLDELRADVDATRSLSSGGGDHETGNSVSISLSSSSFES